MLIGRSHLNAAGVSMGSRECEVILTHVHVHTHTHTVHTQANEAQAGIADRCALCLRISF